jgi:putative NADH-flavin reductase
MGWNVVAFGRNIDDLIDEDLRNQQIRAVKGYVFNAGDVAKALNGSYAVLSALGGSFDGTDKSRSLGIKVITEQMEKQAISRIIAVGGKGVLSVSESDPRLLLDMPDYPPIYKPVGLEHKAALEYLVQSGLQWTFTCSGNLLPAYADEQYVTQANYPLPFENGINTGNLAHFMVHELEVNKYIQQRVAMSNIQ